MFCQASKERNKVSGKISHVVAIEKAQSEYEKFRLKQDEVYISNFDKVMSIYLKGDKKDN